jgi:CSLREA domain-containing protein
LIKRKIGGWRKRLMRLRRRSRLALISATIMVLFLFVRPAHALVFTVDSTGDQGDIAPGDGFCVTAVATCTLRAAIEEANGSGGADTINFNIAPAGPHTIVLGSALPAITSVVTIDGTTQPGFVAAPPYAPVIEVNAALDGGTTLNLQPGSAGSTIRGLCINRSAGSAIRIVGSSGNSIAGNFLGTDLAGTAAGPGNLVGVSIGFSGVTNNNRVGGTVEADRNVISGNTVDGIQIFGAAGGAASNVVQGNYIGVDVNGNAPLGNTNQGVAVFTGNTNTGNVIGGTVAGARNVISGNGGSGIRIKDAGTTGTLVQGNRIGTNAAGTAAIPNRYGIEITDSTSGNTVGGPAGSENLISGNTEFGILITGGANNNTVTRALIGTDAAGTAKIPNGVHGVELNGGASFNTIGGVSSVGNIISGNDKNGVNIIGATTSDNSVLGNTIGLDATGGAILSNGEFGVAVAQGAYDNIIGDGTGGNVISGNDLVGVRIVDNGTDNNWVQNNYIGLDVPGTSEMPNGTGGVVLDTGGVATGNRIGRATFGNVISGNNGVGIRIFNGMTGTLVQDNIIGRDPTNTAAFPNTSGGILINNSSGNTIGGTGVNEGNIIGGNSGGDGIAVVGSVSGNAILGNSIFSNAGLGIDLGNDNVTDNDVGDVDAGPNNLQNFPVLSGAVTDGVDDVHIAGSLNGAASTTYRVEFFAFSAPDPSGHGEGRRYLDFRDITTGGTGYATIAVTLGTLVADGEYVSATATDPSNNTSEFAANVEALGELIVTTTADTVDGTTTSVAALIADTGADDRISLREAIEAVNAASDADTIRFGIPLTDANHYYYQNDSTPNSLTTVAATTMADADISDFDPDYPVGFTRSWYRIRPNPVLPTLVYRVVLDGETQPGFIVGAPVVELDGSAGGGTVGLSLERGPSTVKGFVINRFGDNGLALRGTVESGYTITGNYIGTDISGTMAAGNGSQGIFIGQITGLATTIGGDTAAERNIISGNGRGLYLWAWGAPGISSQIRIQGNYIGPDVTGTVGLGVQVRGVTLEYTGGHLIGGGGAGEGNLISGNAGFGIELNGNNSGGSGTETDNNTIEGNWIGTDASGTAALPNTLSGILMFATSSAASSVSNNTIRGNVIVAAPGGDHGIIVSGNADDNLFENNFIGTDDGGTIDLGNTGHGISISDGGGFLPTGNTVQNNVIRFNDLDGVRIEGTGSGVALTQNQIWSNDGLGINLGTDAVTPNDANDPDSGPNDLLNWPYIYWVSESGGTLTVNFSIDVPASDYRIEFFKNPSGADPSGNGEGQIFAGSRTITHTGSGYENFSHSFPGVVGEVVTATATCTSGAACPVFEITSEFGRAFTNGTTAVELTSFEAIARDRAIDLVWKTGSELNNLGFHLHRSLTAEGPYERVTDVVIPGLGSSPVGTSYSYQDGGLANGIQYFYKLEDIETTGRTKLHGPVSAMPEEEAVPEEEEETEARETSDHRETYGDPSDVSIRVVERDSNSALIELVTGGFLATRVDGGAYRLEVPGFDEIMSESLPALPMKRLWLDVVAGRGVEITSVRAVEVSSFAGLQPVGSSSREIVARREGTVRARARRSRRAWHGAGVVPASAARVVEIGFQQETKKALMELAPLRWNGDSGRLLWARRLLVRVSFTGVEKSEMISRGTRGRQYRARRSHQRRTILKQISTFDSGLYRIRFEDLFRGRRRALAVDTLRLSRLGEPVPYHIEPLSDRFGPGSVLYFFSPGAAANPYGNEAVFELELRTGGRTMPVVDASPLGASTSTYLHRTEWEEDKIYMAGLVDAPSRWLWDVVVSPSKKHYPFVVDSISEADAKLEVFLQGASDFEASPDHNVQVSVNGSVVSEESWDGKAARAIEVVLPPGLLHPGENDLAIENLGDTEASYSMVYLDRFALTYRRETVAEEGRLEGSFEDSGAATLKGLGESSLVLQLSPEPMWLRGLAGSSESVSFQVKAGRRYLAVSPDAVLEPKVRKPSASRLRRTDHQADYIIIGPREFLPAAEPLLERRRSQNLVSRAVPIEEVYDTFGYGEARPEALKELLEYVYHQWEKPSVRYVVLLGDATYDGKDRLGTGVVNRVPTVSLKTSYLWTASDPTYAAVNGEDRLPDLALGRLPAATVEEARALVEKVLAYEDSAQSLSGPVVMVADNADEAGDFEQNSEAIASTLNGRDVKKIYLRELGSVATKREILESFDRGASLVSYAGHGGIALWASESIFESADVASLTPQARQPIVMTMNCLNGFFHFPYFDALAESLLKAGSKGAVAAFSPSGLSLNGPAHVYHQALMTELTSGRHERLGDAVLAAQQRYADSGFFPELLAIYHLFGDPALTLR